MSDLKQRAINGVLWGAIERFSIQGVSFFIMIVMARLLTPSDYGLIGMLSIFMAVAQTLVDSGFSSALIRKQDRTETDVSTVFYFNIVFSVIIYSILYIAAPLVADFYDEPRLLSAMRVLCFVIVINSFAIVQRVMYMSRIDFKTQAKASLTAAIASGIAGIVMAYYGYGMWALITQQLLSATVNTIVLWQMSSWYPKLIYSWKSFREMFNFGSKILVSALLETTYNNIYPIVIGKFFPVSDLGQYTRATHFSQFPSSNITSIVEKVSFPVLCKLQNNDERLAYYSRRMLRISAYIVFPLMIGLSAIAHSFIMVFIGEKWEYCSQLLSIICFSMMWYPIHSINVGLLQVKGRSDLFLRLEIIKKICGVIILCITIPMGLMAMCYGLIFNSVVCLIINTHYTEKLIRVGFFTQMKDLFPIIILCLIMFVSIQLANNFVENYILQLTIDITIGITMYVMLSYLFKIQELNKFISLIKKINKHTNVG